MDEQGITPAVTDREAEEAPEMLKACRVYEGGGWKRAVLEAWLLTGACSADIGARCNISEEAVAAYGSLFFDVRDRLESKGYIVRRIGSPEKAKDRRAWAECQLKRYAYFAGPLILQLMLDLVFDNNGNLRDGPHDLSTENGRTAIRLKLALVVDLPGTAPAQLVEALRTLKKLQAFERAFVHEFSTFGVPASTENALPLPLANEASQDIGDLLGSQNEENGQRKVSKTFKAAS